MTPGRGAMIIEKTNEMGAAMAGIASVELLKRSPSHEILGKVCEQIDGVGFDHLVKWPGEAKSVLVTAVSHPRKKPELDWWDVASSPGHRILMGINRELSIWIEEELGIKTHMLNYSVMKGGAYLKDAAVLGGLGCIGRNNLLVTPEYGPRVRLLGMLLEAELAPTGPIDFDPCDGCEEPCREACPQNAFEEVVLSSVDMGMATLPGRDGRFSRARCTIQMENDVSDAREALDESQMEGDHTKDASGEGDAPGEGYASGEEDASHEKGVIKYCRRCEFACPVGS